MSDHVVETVAPAASEPAARLRLLVVDADDRTRESLVGILGIRHRFRVVGSTGLVAEAISLVRDERPDVVILDPRLPEVSGGVTLIRRIRAIDPGVHILAVGWSPDLENAALTAGAHCFMRKTLKPDELAIAVARCMTGGVSPGSNPSTHPEPAPHPDPSTHPDPTPGPGPIL
jgi:DNA-binding NarL/FixJ family response regulator